MQGSASFAGITARGKTPKPKRKPKAGKIVSKKKGKR
jgi:hypothetical protein